MNFNGNILNQIQKPNSEIPNAGIQCNDLINNKDNEEEYVKYINNSSPDKKENFFENKNYKSNFLQHQNQINNTTSHNHNQNQNNKFMMCDESDVVGGEAALKYENSVYISDNHSLMIDKENLMKILPNFQNFNTIDLNTNHEHDPLDSSKDSVDGNILNNDQGHNVQVKNKKVNLNNSSRITPSKGKITTVSNFSSNNAKTQSGFHTSNNPNNLNPYSNFPKANTITLSNTASAGFGVNYSNQNQTTNQTTYQIYNNTSRNTLTISNPFKSAVKSARGHSSSNIKSNLNSDGKNSSNTNRTLKGRISLLESHNSKRSSYANLNKEKEVNKETEQNRENRENREYSNSKINCNSNNSNSHSNSNNCNTAITSNVSSNLVTNTLKKSTYANNNNTRSVTQSNQYNNFNYNTSVMPSTSNNLTKVNNFNNIPIPLPSYVTNSSMAHASNRTNRQNRKSSSRHYRINYHSNANRYDVFSNYTSNEANSGNNTPDVSQIKFIDNKEEGKNSQNLQIFSPEDNLNNNNSYINNNLVSDSIRTNNTVNTLDKTTSKSKLSLGKYSHLFGDVMRGPTVPGNMISTHSNRHFKKASTDQRVCSTQEGGSVNGVDIANAKSMSMNLEFNECNACNGFNGFNGYNECNHKRSALEVQQEEMEDSNIIQGIEQSIGNIANLGSFINLEDNA